MVSPQYPESQMVSALSHTLFLAMYNRLVIYEGYTCLQICALNYFIEDKINKHGMRIFLKKS